MVDYLPLKPDVILIAPDPAKPGHHTRFSYRRVISAQPAVIAIDGRTLRSA